MFVNAIRNNQELSLVQNTYSKDRSKHVYFSGRRVKKRYSEIAFKRLFTRKYVLFCLKFSLFELLIVLPHLQEAGRFLWNRKRPPFQLS